MPDAHDRAKSSPHQQQGQRFREAQYAQPEHRWKAELQSIVNALKLLAIVIGIVSHTRDDAHHAEDEEIAQGADYSTCSQYIGVLQLEHK